MMEERRTLTEGDQRLTVTGGDQRRTMTEGDQRRTVTEGDQRRTLTRALTSMQRCTASKMPKRKPRPEPVKCPVDCKEQERRDRYARLMYCAPDGFREVLELIIRTVLLARPIHVCRFIADLLDAELSRRTFDDIVYGCKLKKSLKKKPYPSDSCMVLTTWLMQCTQKKTDTSEFTRGIIPQYELDAPALDRYRDYADIGEFDMSMYEDPEPPPVEEEQRPESKPAEAPLPDLPDELEFPKSACYAERGDGGVPAIDRYRDYAGIGPFEPDDVADECFDRGPHASNCKCTFCLLKAEKSRPSSCVPPGPTRDPCAKKPVVQTLYIEQPVYREPQHDNERLFRESHKSCAPFSGPFIEQDDYYADDGLQPPDPFKEHPCDCDKLADSPDQDGGDDPHEDECADPVEQEDKEAGDEDMEATECPDPEFRNDEEEGDEAEAQECADPVFRNDEEEGDEAEEEECADPEQKNDEEEECAAAPETCPADAEQAPEEATAEEQAPEEPAPEEAAPEEAAPEEAAPVEAAASEEAAPEEAAPEESAPEEAAPEEAAPEEAAPAEEVPEEAAAEPAEEPKAEEEAPAEEEEAKAE